MATENFLKKSNLILDDKFKLTIYTSIIKDKNLLNKEKYLYCTIISIIKTLRRHNLSTKSFDISLLFSLLKKSGYTRPRREFDSVLRDLSKKDYIYYNDLYITIPDGSNKKLYGQAKDYLFIKYRKFTKTCIDLVYSKELALRADRKTKKCGVISYTNQDKVASTVGCSRSTVAEAVKDKDLIYVYKNIASFVSKKEAIQFKNTIKVQESGKYLVNKTSSGKYAVLRLDGSKKLSAGDYFVKNGKKARSKKSFQSNYLLRDQYVRIKANSGHTTIVIKEAYDYRLNQDYTYSNTYIKKDIL